MTTCALVVGRGGPAGARATEATLESLVRRWSDREDRWRVVLLLPRDEATSELAGRLEGALQILWDELDPVRVRDRLRRAGDDVILLPAGDAAPRPTGSSLPRIPLVDDQFAGFESGTGLFSATDGQHRFRWDRELDGSLQEPLMVFTDTSVPRVAEFRARRRVAWLLESPDVNTEGARFVLANPDVFDLVLTSDLELLPHLPRAVHVPAGGCWVPSAQQVVADKTRLCSIIASKKAFTEGHRFRLGIAEAVNGVDRFGRGHDGEPGYREMADKSEALVPYRYSITVENCRRRGYFSEKLIDCFRTGTIPIYWGAPDVADYFDPAGMLVFDTLDDLSGALATASADHYRTVLPAVRRNYETAAGYRVVEDRLWPLLRPFMEDA